MIGYFLKFKNFTSHPEGTGKLHYNVLKEKGRVIWGQWRNGQNILNRKTKQEMLQNTPFTLYILDKENALLKLTVVDVLDKEEVIEKEMEEYIPSYYSIETPCSAYYLLSNIEILPVDESASIININTGRSVYYSNQVNSTTPWRVTETTDKIEIYEPAPKIAAKIEEAEPVTEAGATYSVYKYHLIGSDKNYIGMTNNISRRRKEHENPTNWKRDKKKYLYVMMSMLGLENFEFEILHEGLTEEEAHYWEAKEIENHNSYYPNGLNERNEARYLNK